MSASVELHDAILALLLADAGVSAIVGTRIHDGRPSEYPCITFGPIDIVSDDAECIDGRIETVQLDCWVRDGDRLWPTQRLADAVKKALHGAEPDLATHALSIMDVSSVRCFMDPDGLTGHGVVIVDCAVEEVTS